jgi:hypothetical protein
MISATAAHRRGRFRSGEQHARENAVATRRRRRGVRSRLGGGVPRSHSGAAAGDGRSIPVRPDPRVCGRGDPGLPPDGHRPVRGSPASTSRPSGRIRPAWHPAVPDGVPVRRVPVAPQRCLRPAGDPYQLCLGGCAPAGPRRPRRARRLRAYRPGSRQAKVWARQPLRCGWNGESGGIGEAGFAGPARTWESLHANLFTPVDQHDRSDLAGQAVSRRVKAEANRGSGIDQTIGRPCLAG